jgi:RNA polymerase sigma factor (sigma-70 family)
MYGTAVREELSAEELEAARLGFRQMLRRKRISSRFIEAHGDDLLARARFEYSRAVGRGDEIRSPAGWIIHCAWRRTQNQLESESHEPQLVSTEVAADVVDVASPTPEQAAIYADRARAIEVAMAELSHDQRTLIELSYFEGLSVREAGRFLHWHSSKAQRTHEAALRKLREALGISDVDELAIEIGLAAWVSLSASKQVLPTLPGGLEAVADASQRGAQGLWARAHELARRVLTSGGGEPTSAAVSSGAARAAGVCGAAAVACLAGGIVGPGVGRVVGFGAQHYRAPPAKVAQRPPGETPIADPGEERPIESEEPAPPSQAETGGGAHGRSTRESAAEQRRSPQSKAEGEFGAFGSTGTSSGRGEGRAPASSYARSSTTDSAASVPSSSSTPPSADSSNSSASREFGAFK